MKSLVPLATPSAAQWYDDISGARRPSLVVRRLTRARPEVRRAYAAYVGPVETLVQLVPRTFGEPTRRDLRANYDSKARVSRDLKAKIFSIDPTRRCGLCGAGRAATLDHYLPKDDFPEFAVLPLNLVPACDPCNRNKGVKFIDAGEPMFLHSYLDAIPRCDQFLFADVTAHGVDFAVTYSVSAPGHLDPKLAARIECHFNELDLATVYATEAIDWLGEVRRDFQRMRGSGATPADVAGDLGHRAAAVAADKGNNHWRFALLQALAANVDFCTVP